MVEVIFGSEVSSGWSFTSNEAVRHYSANRIEEVIPLLIEVERAATEGAWVALMLSYEASSAFDPALKTHTSADFPLAWAAIFDRPGSRDLSSPGNVELQRAELEPGIPRSDFFAAVASIRDLIARGDTYQVNLTFPFTAHLPGDPREWYRALCLAQEARYSVYLDLGKYQVLSLSPELFFERNGRAITTRPMKGTIRRGRWSAEDEEMAQTLAGSAKDRAENVMIVDLLRNDLGKVAEPGTVKVSRLYELERYPTLWQMTSTVEARLRAGTGLKEIMTALFPCGSITGAPKIRTMEIIRDLEPFPRNVYTGTIGLIRPGGDCTFNVAIRTLILDSTTRTAKLGVGGGITYDSNAESEYEECLLKSSFLRRTRPEFRLLESILVENGDLFLLERHLNRLRSSAEYFGFEFSEERVLNELTGAVARCLRGKWKIRLLLARDGEISTSEVELEQLRSPRQVCLAESPVDENNPFLFHKTTNRQVYEASIRADTDCDDQIFWNASGEITESKFANVVVRSGGSLWTPPQDSGLLAGTFREELLARGEIRERVISIEELRTAKEFFLINSVRRWMPAVLVD